MAQLETTRDIVLRLAMRVDEIMDQHSGVENGTFPRVVQDYWVEAIDELPEYDSFEPAPDDF